MNLNPYNLTKIDLVDDNFESMVFKNKTNNISDFQLLNDNTFDDDVIMSNQEQIIESFDNQNDENDENDENDKNDLDYVYENFNSNILDIFDDENNNDSDDEKEFFFGKSFRKFGRSTRKIFSKSKKKRKDKIVKTLITIENNKVECPLQYGDKIILAYSSNTNNTNNCGLYGCRVASIQGTGLKDKRNLEFGHGGLNPISFYLRPPVDGTKKNGDYIQFGDGIVLAYSNNNGNTNNCGYYGCRVATTSNKNGRKIPVRFNHGGKNPKVFYILPMKDSKNKNGQLIHYNDEIILSLGTNSNNCGYGGCRVLQMYDNKLGYVNHGNKVKKGFYLRKIIGETCKLDKEIIKKNGSFKITKLVIRCSNKFELSINKQKFESSDSTKPMIIEGKDIKRNYSYGNILALKCSNSESEGGLIISVELENGSNIFSNKEWDASNDVNNPNKFLNDPANYNYESSWTKAEEIVKNDDDLNPWGFDYDFSPENNWIWLGDNTIAGEVYFKRTLGIPGDILKCNANLTNNQALCYADNNPEIQTKFKNNIRGLKKHWKTNGCIEDKSYACQSPPPTIGNYDWKGCYNDNSSTRVIPNNRGTVVNGDACSKLAEKNSDMVFGLQYDNEEGIQCWTGNNIDKAKSLGNTPVSCSINGKELGNQVYYRNEPFIPSSNNLKSKNFEHYENNQNNTINSSMNNYYYLMIILLFISIVILILFFRK